MLQLLASSLLGFAPPVPLRGERSVSVTMSYGGGSNFKWAPAWKTASASSSTAAVATPPAAASSASMTVAQACAFMSSMPDTSLSEKVTFLKSQGVSDSIIAQSSCCSNLGDCGPIQG